MMIKFFETYKASIKAKVVQWKLPAERQFKCNVDSEFKCKLGLITHAFFIKDIVGELVSVAAYNFGVSTSLEAKNRAMVKWLESCVAQNHLSVINETYS